MILSALSGWRATTFRLVGLCLIAWTVLANEPASALRGRGLVALIALVAGVIAWLVWTFWSHKQARLTPDLFVLAICGGVIQSAETGSAGVVMTFVAAMGCGARVGLLPGLTVALAGAVATAVGGLIYDLGGVTILAYALGFAATTLGGSNIKQMRDRAEQAELLVAQTQRSHEEQRRAEQLRHQAAIARDIHDVLAHSLAGLTIQLEATSALIEAGAAPDQVKARVDRAYQLAREGLGETRRAVAALRGEQRGSEPAGTQIDAQLQALASGYSDGHGSPAALIVDGDAQLLTGQPGDTVLRAVQEAITNVRKHAPGASVEITVDAGASDPNTVSVTIENGEPGAVTVGAGSLADTGGGYGLRGMRERAELVGGTLTAGPIDAGWKVTLTIPAGAAQ